MTDLYPEDSMEWDLRLSCLRLQRSRERAEEIVRRQGHTEQDPDFWLRLEHEIRHQWDLAWRRELDRRRRARS